MPRRPKLTTDVEAWEHGPPADCSLAAQGLLTRMRMYMLQSERPGHLLVRGKPMTTETLAKRVGDSIDSVACLEAELLDKEALKRDEGGVLYDPQLVGDLHRREKGAQRTRRWRGSSPQASRDASRDGTCDARCDAQPPSQPPSRDASRLSPPPFPSPSHTLPLPLTPSPLPDSSNPCDGVPPLAVKDEAKKTAKAPRPRTGRVLTDEQHEARKQFGDWWCGVYPRFHNGQLFEFVGSRDGPAILDLMRRQQIHWDLDRAKAIAEYYLGLWEGYFPDHPLWSLAKRANYFARKIDERNQFGASHVLRPTGTCDADNRAPAPTNPNGAGGVRQTPILNLGQGAGRGAAR